MSGPTALVFVRRSGFSLLEVLVAMGLFVVAFIMLASIFPISVLLQRQATDLIRSQEAARSAKGMLRGRRLNQSELIDPAYGLPADPWSAGYDSDRRVYPLPASAGRAFLPETGYAAPPQNWSLSDRSFPTTTEDPRYRELYWVPLVRDADPATGAGNSNWEVYVFILRRDDLAVYNKPALAAPDRWANPLDPEGSEGPPRAPGAPGVRSVGVSPSASDSASFEFLVTGFNAGRDIQAGDAVLDNFGYVYHVSEADDDSFQVVGYIFPNAQTGQYPDTIWYGKPSAPGRSSPTMDIMVLTGVVR